MKRFFTVSTIVLALGPVLAAASRLPDQQRYYPSSFYENVENGESDGALKRELFSILNSPHLPVPGGHDVLSSGCTPKTCYKQVILGYFNARKLLFGDLHLERHGSDYAIRDVYCQHLFTDGDFIKDPPGPGLIPDPGLINVEHTWPQSKFSKNFPTEMQKSDLHILFPADSDANTSRSNHEFGEVVTPLATPCALSKRGYTAGGGKKIFFEPPEVHKGNVARAIFYFSIRYKAAVSAEQEASLRAWHRQDPPDRPERERHEEIFAKQKVRNPFIDHPELVDLIRDF